MTKVPCPLFLSDGAISTESSRVQPAAGSLEQVRWCRVVRSVALSRVAIDLKLHLHRNSPLNSLKNSCASHSGGLSIHLFDPGGNISTEHWLDF